MTLHERRTTPLAYPYPIPPGLAGLYLISRFLTSVHTVTIVGRRSRTLHERDRVMKNAISLHSTHCSYMVAKDIIHTSFAKNAEKSA
jgi:hypothetical protein